MPPPPRLRVRLYHSAFRRRGTGRAPPAARSLGRTYQVDEVRLAYRLHEAERTVPLPVPERLHDT
ncbi:hypothetical protein [Nocardia abscessus]|uniref:hypothetical protein n=1 Tax=Nocardia abscessus TaxID=120957 RepID=UPI002457F883|nr:hypothetical protein [Nocardia abscessus]